MGFSGILGHILQFLNSSDSVICWVKSEAIRKVSILCSKENKPMLYFKRIDAREQ